MAVVIKVSFQSIITQVERDEITSPLKCSLFSGVSMHESQEWPLVQLFFLMLLSDYKLNIGLSKVYRACLLVLIQLAILMKQALLS